MNFKKKAFNMYEVTFILKTKALLTRQTLLMNMKDRGILHQILDCIILNEIKLKIYGDLTWYMVHGQNLDQFTLQPQDIFLSMKND